MAVSFGYFAPRLEFEQFPSKDGDNIQVDVSFPAGTPFKEKKEVFVKVQDKLVQLPHFQSFYTFGNIIWATFTQPIDREDNMTIFEIEEQYDQKLDEVRAEISEDIVITPQASSYGPPLDQFDIVVNFLGTDKEALTKAVDDLELFLQNKEGIEEIQNGPRQLLVPAIEVNLNQDKLAKKGVNSLAAASTINAIFAPQNIGSMIIREDGLSDEVIINFSTESTDSVDDLKNLLVPSNTGGLVKLSEVADIDQVENPVSTRRLKNKRVATVSLALTEGTDRAAFDKEIKDYLSEEKLLSLGLPKDGVSYGGEFSAFETDFSNLQIVFVLAILAVYLILVWQFYSYMQPALIMVAIPLALIGVFPGLLLVGSTLNMISGLGVIALIGIVVNDAIVLIATYNRYKEEHPEDNTLERLVRAGHTRFKPIFSTSITTIGGILPLTILDPFWTGLGTSIIAGLVFSTIGTLIAMPMLYSIIVSAYKKIARRKSSNNPSSGQIESVN